MPENSLGDILRSLREEQNLSLDQLHARTKILITYIQAIEDGRWDLLPGQVYLKPFVKSIAEALGADYEELCALIDKSDKNQVIDRAESPGKRFDYRWLALALMVVLAGLVIFLLRPVKTPPVETESQETTAVVMPEEKNVIFERQYTSDLDIQPEPVIIPQAHTLEMTATDSVWVMLTAGDDTVYVGILRPNRKLTRESTEPFSLLMGRSNCLEVIYDNVRLDSNKYLLNKRRLDFSEMDLTEIKDFEE